MFGSLYVTGALTGLLGEFLDSEQLALPELRQRMARVSPDSRVPLSEWLNWLDAIAIACPRPALGLAIGERAAPRHGGVLGYLGVSCDTLGEALWRFNRFNRLVYDGNAVAMQMTGNEVAISWGVEHGRPGQLADETAIAAFATLTRMLVSQPIGPLSVQFVNPAPPDISPYTRFFGCPVTFNGALTTVRFPVAYLSLPISNSDPTLRHLLDQQAEAQLKALPASDPFETALNQALVRSLHEGHATLEQVAVRLAITPRTLQRRLAARELNYQGLLDRTRAELARSYLGDPGLALSDIALLLGFSEQSAFNRAFRRWYSQSPRAMRQALLQSTTKS